MDPFGGNWATPCQEYMQFVYAHTTGYDGNTSNGDWAGFVAALAGCTSGFSGIAGGAGGGGGTPYYRQHPCDRNDPTNATFFNFMNAHKADAQELADGNGIPWEWILAVGAEETGWGQKGIVTNTNNFFGLHVNGKRDIYHYVYQVSTYLSQQDGWVATFGQQTGFLDSGYNFLLVEKQWIAGAQTIGDFAADINKHGYGVGNPNFVSLVSNVTGLIQARENCPPAN